MDKILFRIFSSPASIYVVLRYITYVLKFFNLIYLVPVLGEYSYGIYSFIVMFSAYAIYFNLGFNESLNSEYAVCKEGNIKRKEIWDNALSFTLLWNLLTVCSFIMLLYIYPNLFNKYQFYAYGHLLLIACFAHNISTLYATLYKLKGLTLKLNLQQLLPQISLLFLIIIKRDNIDIYSIVLVILLTEILMLLICIYGSPYKFKFSFNKETINTLMFRGFSLLLYNLSFQLLTIITQSFVSVKYAVEQMGLYSFANNIANGVIMAGGAFLYIFSPKLINRISQGKDVAIRLINRMRNVYIVFMDSVSLMSILCVLFLGSYILEYGKGVVEIYALLMLGRIINNASAGYATYMIAYKKEIILVVFGFISILLVSLFCGFIYMYNLDIKVVSLGVLLASFVYTFLIILSGLKSLDSDISTKNIMNEIFGRNKWIICLMVLVYVYIYSSSILLLSGVLVYYILSLKHIKSAFKDGMSVILDKKSLNIN